VINSSQVLFGMKLVPEAHCLRVFRTSSVNERILGRSCMVTEFFNLPDPSSYTMVLASTQPPTQMGTRSLPGV
jgi:hypothetical protein